MSRRGGQRGGGGFLLPKIASGIGLAAEAIQHQKNKSKSSKPASPQERPVSGTGASASATIEAHPADDPPPYSVEDQDQTLGRKQSDGENVVTEHDEAIWQLDEAAAELETPAPAKRALIPKGIAKDPASISVLVDAFISAYPPAVWQGPADLPCPVIIPQRRPSARTRGFVRAYSPYLEPCGISEDTFMQFLDFYDESLEFSNVIKVIHLAGAVVGFVPSAACMIASAALNASAAVARNVHSKQRSNDFITRMNQQYFMPMGLVCLVMKFSPDAQAGNYDLDVSVANASTRVHSNLRSSHGLTNEMELPQAAPLIFPALDHTEDEEKLSKFARTKRFIVQYQDRRAQAKFEVENPNSKLAEPMQGRTAFESNLADPRKTGNMFDLRGGIHSAISQYSGVGGGSGRGAGTPAAQGYDTHSGDRRDSGWRRGGLGGLAADRLAVHRDSRAAHRGFSRQDQNADSHANASYGSLGRGRAPNQPGGRLLDASPINLIKKAIKQDVLYMMIVPMPSKEDMEQVQCAPPTNVQIVDVSV